MVHVRESLARQHVQGDPVILLEVRIAQAVEGNRRNNPRGERYQADYPQPADVPVIRHTSPGSKTASFL